MAAGGRRSSLSPGLLPQRTIGLDKPPHVDIMSLCDFFSESGLTQVAYLGPHFDPDVFVSYAHGDPRHVGESPLKVWTVALVRRLESQILSLDTEYDALQIWMDEQIDPTAQLTEELRSKAAGSGILIIVMSKRYLASSWCRDELEWFRKQIQDRAGEPGRVFVIRAQPTDQAAWPDFLRDERGYAMPGFSFHDPVTGLPWGWPDLAETDRDFVKEMCRLQTALTKRLRELRDRAEKRSQAEAAGRPAIAPQSGVPQSGAHRIYLHAPSDCEPARVEIGRVLTQDGLVPLTARVSAEGALRAGSAKAAPESRRPSAARRSLCCVPTTATASSANCSTSAWMSARGSQMRAGRPYPARFSTTPGRACRST